MKLPASSSINIVIIITIAIIMIISSHFHLHLRPHLLLNRYGLWKIVIINFNIALSQVTMDSPSSSKF